MNPTWIINAAIAATYAMEALGWVLLVACAFIAEIYPATATRGLYSSFLYVVGFRVARGALRDFWGE